MHPQLTLYTAGSSEARHGETVSINRYAVGCGNVLFVSAGQLGAAAWKSTQRAVDPSAPTQLVGIRKSIILVYPGKAHPHWVSQGWLIVSKAWLGCHGCGSSVSPTLVTLQVQLCEQEGKTPKKILGIFYNTEAWNCTAEIFSQDPFPSGIWSHMCSHHSPRNPMPRRESFLWFFMLLTFRCWGFARSEEVGTCFSFEKP